MRITKVTQVIGYKCLECDKEMSYVDCIVHCTENKHTLKHIEIQVSVEEFERQLDETRKKHFAKLNDFKSEKGSLDIDNLEPILDI